MTSFSSWTVERSISLPSAVQQGGRAVDEGQLLRGLYVVSLQAALHRNERSGAGIKGTQRAQRGHLPLLFHSSLEPAAVQCINRSFESGPKTKTRRAEGMREEGKEDEERGVQGKGKRGYRVSDLSWAFRQLQWARMLPCNIEQATVTVSAGVMIRITEVCWFYH